MSEKKGSKKARSKDLTPKLSKDELLRRLKVSMQGRSRSGITHDTGRKTDLKCNTQQQ